LQKARRELEDGRAQLDVERKELKDKNQAELDVQRKELEAERKEFMTELQNLEKELGNAKVEVIGVKSRLEFEISVLRNKCESLEKALQQSRTIQLEKHEYLNRIKGMEKLLKQAQDNIKQYETVVETVHEGDLGDLDDLFNDLSNDEEGRLDAILRIHQRAKDEAVRVQAILLSKEQEIVRIKRLRDADKVALLKEKEKHKVTKTSLENLEERHANVSTRMEKLEKIGSGVQVLVGPAPTPRSILMTITSALDVGGSASKEPSPSAPLPDGFTAQYLHSSMLDITLIPDDVHTVIDAVSSNSKSKNLIKSLELQVCSVCDKQRFTVSHFQEEREFSLNEFPLQFGQTKCCDKPVCTHCYSSFFRSALRNDWWHNLESQSWLRCPVETCKQPIEISSSEELATRINELDDIDADAAVQT
jgi:hypothetical protein